MNQELGKQFCHQILLDAPSLSDSESAAKGCSTCLSATLAEAGRMARALSNSWEFTEEFTNSGRTLPTFSDVVWTEGIVERWDGIVSIAHSKHAN